MLQFDDIEADHLKKWLVKRLEDISDADSEVLADYVLALVRSDEPDDQVRANCLENLEDFLRDHTSTFVDDILTAVNAKSYMPGYVAPSSALPPTSFNNRVSDDTNSSTGLASQTTGVPSGPSSRKRGYNDRSSVEPTGPPSGERAFKQMRRGGSRGRGHDMLNGRGGYRASHSDRGGFGDRGQFQNMPMLSGMPPGFPPLDPSNPMAAIMAMQAMGFPALPGFPGFPSGSPTGQTSVAMSKSRTGERCRDYDTKGFCAAGSSCPYEHGNDHIVVPGSADAYDPSNINFNVAAPVLTANGTHDRLAPSRPRRSDRGRGRGGRHDRGGRSTFSSAGPNLDRGVTSVVVEQIPEEKFNEESVREFFGEFGTINDVTLKPYKRLAIVKYSDWASANKAYSSPKVIFDNRFVKVFWHRADDSATSQNGTSNSEHNGTSANPHQEDAEMIDPAEFERKQAEAQRTFEEKARKLKEAEEAKEELDRRIKAQAEERKKLLEKLASKTTAGATAIQTATASPLTAKSTQTEILRAKLAELEAEADSLGLSATATSPGDTSGTWYAGAYHRGGRGGRGARGSYRGYAPRGRGGAVARLDNRPRTVAVSGVDWKDSNGREEALRQHLFGIGADFEGIEVKDTNANGAANASSGAGAGAGAGKNILEIAFPQRYVAENFMASARSGEIEGVGKVEFAWVPNKPISAGAGTIAAATASAPMSANTAVAESGSALAQDAVMSESNADPSAGKAADVDYDVAEDDEDRWMAT